MSVEGATYISQLDPANPDGSGPRGEGDNHICLIKGSLKNTFPAFVGAAVTVTEAELNTVPNLAPKASPAFTGTPTAPTAPSGTGTTQIATMEALQSAIAAVNAQTGVVPSFNAGASFAVTDGQIVAATNAGAVAVDFTAAPAVGAIRGTVFDNNRLDNTVDLGARSVMGWNGFSASGVITCDMHIPFVVRWFGDYWRPI